MTRVACACTWYELEYWDLYVCNLSLKPFILLNRLDASETGSTISYSGMQANALRLRVLRTLIPTYPRLIYMFDLNRTLYMCGYSYIGYTAHARTNQGCCTDININFSLQNYWILQPTFSLIKLHRSCRRPLTCKEKSQNVLRKNF